MNGLEDDTTSDLLTAPQADERAPAGERPSRAGTAAAVPVAGSETYRDAARACLPRWLRMLGPAPWLNGPGRFGQGQEGQTRAPYVRQAATLAIALTNEMDYARPDADYLRECVRASLIHWQLSLRSDGRPAHRHFRRSPLQGAVTGCVVQLLTETSGFQTDGLLADLDRHLHWLAGNPPQTPWIEAATVGALADGALLVRRRALLDTARRRLRSLLARQNEEGWFPERGGADLGRLSLTVDTLARLQRHNDWEELSDPLHRALSFLRHVVHPDGSIGGIYSSCGTGFLSPYGVELLAPSFPDAAALAATCRERYRRFNVNLLPAWDDELCATLGPPIALTAIMRAPLPAPALPSCREPLGQVHFPHAGLSIFRTPAYHAVVGGKRGGALQVIWRDGHRALEEPGPTVFFSHRIRTSTRWDRRTRTHCDHRSVTCRGVLSCPLLESGSRWRWFGQWARWIWTRATVRQGMRRTRPARGASRHYHRVAHDRFRRDVTFDDDSIRIRDVIQCRLPCQKILCRSAPPRESTALVDRDVSASGRYPPIFIDGGRQVTITRVYRQGELVDTETGPGLPPASP